MRKVGQKIAVMAVAGTMLAMALACGTTDTDVTKIGEVSEEEKTEVQKTEADKTEADKTEPEETEVVETEETETEAPETTETAQTEFYVGDVLKASGLEITYVASGDYVSDNQFLQPADGNKYIYIELYVKNTSDSEDIITSYDFECYADGYSADEAYVGEEDELSATLSSGRTTEGRLYYEVPANSSDIEIEYEYDSWNDKKVTFIYEGNKDSGFVPEADTSASENAYKVGDILDTGDMKITYLSCGPYSGMNEYDVPRDGYKYITLEFEIENCGDDDETIDSFEFECYADGSSCDGYFGRDDDLSATISSGRKAKGTVSFEVPTNASTVEVEYVSNYWTSERIVFTYSE